MNHEWAIDMETEGTMEMDGWEVKITHIRAQPITKHPCICPGQIIYGPAPCGSEATQEDMLCDACRNEPKCIEGRQHFGRIK